jgi:hypothetical protein
METIVQTIKAMSGEITIVTPGKINAGNWKQRDLPPPFFYVM